MVEGDQAIGLGLALASSVFIGTSFIIKKRGLRLAGSTGLRAGAGGFSYLREPVWWAGFLTMAAGEVANFAAYAFAPAVLVTPLGALSIIISAVLADMLLNEKLNLFGWVGVALCINGSVTIVLHAPPERELASVLQVWELAMQPGFLSYVAIATVALVYLIYVAAPRHGTTNIFIYLAICSVAGSLSVVSCKAVGAAVKMTVEGAEGQLRDPHLLVFIAALVACLLTQVDYLNRALDLFNTAVVSPIYYVMFTLLSILASAVMFRDAGSPLQLATAATGFITIVGGTFVLHATRDAEAGGLLDLERLTKGGERGSGGGAGGGGGGEGATGGARGGGAAAARQRGRRVPGSAVGAGIELASAGSGGVAAGGPGSGSGKHVEIDVAGAGDSTPGGGGGGANGGGAAGAVREDEPLLPRNSSASSSRKR